MAANRRDFLKGSAAAALAAALQQRRFAHAAQTDLRTAADAVLRRVVAQGDAPGVVAMATTRDGPIYEGGFGERAWGQGAAMTPDTVCWIASMTKAITAAAAMQLVEQGRLALDAPASRVYPPLADAQVLAGWANGMPVLRPPKTAITLRHLLTHTAGFGYEHWSADIQAYQKAMGLPGIGSCRNEALRMPLLYEPGERWNYGINIDFAGKMVEAVSGRRLGEYLAQNLFAPLGMDSTAFRLTPALDARRARVHERLADGTFKVLAFVMTQEPEFEMGGGGLYSTCGDYLKFVRMILDGGKGNGNRVLAPETVAMMSRNAMGALKVGMLASALPHRTVDAEFFPGMPKGWGLSFMINDEPAPTGRSAGSLAWAGLANTFFWIDPAKGVGGVYLTQVFPFVEERSLAGYYAFEKSVYDAIA
ncbi:MAG TPA: serine hydrolase domain-containing protein [Burkholderiales bacterium]|nr:serine hydrolase domain-containing protein [Burkholderiales bacterium]